MIPFLICAVDPVNKGKDDQTGAFRILRGTMSYCLSLFYRFSVIWLFGIFVVQSSCAVPDRRSTFPEIPPFGLIPESPALKQGIATTEVTDQSALVWVQAEDMAAVEIHLFEGAPEEPIRLHGVHRLEISPERDRTGVMPFVGLTPDRAYHYRVFAQKGKGSVSKVPDHPEAVGRFVTPPLSSASRPVRFVWGGDLGGQSRCRTPGEGYEIFTPMLKAKPDFALLLGDLIYGDDPCLSPPNLSGSDFVSTTVDQFRAKHRYQREDPALQRFLAAVPVYAMWDDHEVWNDFSGPHDPQMPAGRQAFLEYWPIEISVEAPHRLYRKVHRGLNLDVFILDTRQYRSSNGEPDGEEKTMLGRTQRNWLIEGLASSRATWKVIVSSVSLSFQKGGPEKKSANDSWARGRGGTGFHTERAKVVGAILAGHIRNVVWLTTDVHFAQVLAYDPDSDGEADFHEFICGPLSARPLSPGPPEPSLNPTVLYEEGGFLNFGQIDIDGSSLRLQIIDGTGATKFQFSLPAR